MRLLSLLSALALLTACDMATTTEVTPTSVGNLRIGMPASQVSNLEGSFKASQMNDECLQMPNKGHGLLLMFTKGILARVDIVRGDYKTPEGIQLGSSEKDVKARLWQTRCQPAAEICAERPLPQRHLKRQRLCVRDGWRESHPHPRRQEPGAQLCRGLFLVPAHRRRNQRA